MNIGRPLSQEKLMNGVIEVNPSTEILHKRNYYPFGLKHKGYNNVVTSTNPALRFKFGGSEYDESLGINSYDFGERNYNSDLGRWFNIDPFAEFMRNQSPYNFGFNNPTYFSDYAGTIPWPIPEFFKNWRRNSKPDEFFGFIKRRGRNHNGIDLNFNGGENTDLGAPIVATHSGRVVSITPHSANNGGGRIIVIESPDGSFQTKYMHLSSVVVQYGQEISEGQTIGLMGGSAFGKELGRLVHLHYEIHRRNPEGSFSPVNPWVNGRPIDPQLWISTMDPFQDAKTYDNLQLVINPNFTDILFGAAIGSADSSDSNDDSGSNSNSGRGSTPNVPNLPKKDIQPLPVVIPGADIVPPNPSPSPPPGGGSTPPPPRRNCLNPFDC